MVHFVLGLILSETRFKLQMCTNLLIQIFKIFFLVSAAEICSPGVPNCKFVEPQHVHHSAVF